jgi:hypothetical protein
MVPTSTSILSSFAPAATPSQVLILQRRLEQVRRDNRNDRNNNNNNRH